MRRFLASFSKYFVYTFVPCLLLSGCKPSESGGGSAQAPIPDGLPGQSRVDNGNVPAINANTGMPSSLGSSMTLAAVCEPLPINKGYSGISKAGALLDYEMRISSGVSAYCKVNQPSITAVQTGNPKNDCIVFRPCLRFSGGNYEFVIGKYTKTYVPSAAQGIYKTVPPDGTILKDNEIRNLPTTEVLTFGDSNGMGAFFLTKISSVTSGNVTASTTITQDSGTHQVKKIQSLDKNININVTETHLTITGTVIGKNVNYEVTSLRGGGVMERDINGTEIGYAVPTGSPKVYAFFNSLTKLGYTVDFNQPTRWLSYLTGLLAGNPIITIKEALFGSGVAAPTLEDTQNPKAITTTGVGVIITDSTGRSTGITYDAQTGAVLGVTTAGSSYSWVPRSNKQLQSETYQKGGYTKTTAIQYDDLVTGLPTEITTTETSGVVTEQKTTFTFDQSESNRSEGIYKTSTETLNGITLEGKTFEAAKGAYAYIKGQSSTSGTFTSNLTVSDGVITGGNSAGVSFNGEYDNEVITRVKANFGSSISLESKPDSRAVIGSNVLGENTSYVFGTYNDSSSTSANPDPTTPSSNFTGAFGTSESANENIPNLTSSHTGTTTDGAATTKGSSTPESGQLRNHRESTGTVFGVAVKNEVDCTSTFDGETCDYTKTVGAQRYPTVTTKTTVNP